MPKKRRSNTDFHYFPKRRRVIYSDSSSDSDYSDVEIHADNEIPKVQTNALHSPDHIEPVCDIRDVLNTPVVPNLVQLIEAEPVQSEDLDEEILLALGEATDDTPNFGANIHENLAQRWQPILRKGLPKDLKEKLLKDYLVPDNCRLLQAPKLNGEIAFILSDMSKNRDKKKEIAQQQLGVGISAINKGLTLLLQQDKKIEAIKALGDGCRLLTDLHFLESSNRKKLITPGLDKTFLNFIQDGSDRDETLFGSTLSAKISASKALTSGGRHIKKNASVQKNSSYYPNTTPSTSGSRYQGNQGNWAGPSRYPPANRGGRAVQRRAPPPPPAPSRYQAPLTRSNPPRVSSMLAKTRQSTTH